MSDMNDDLDLGATDEEHEEGDGLEEKDGEVEDINPADLDEEKIAEVEDPEEVEGAPVEDDPFGFGGLEYDADGNPIEDEDEDEEDEEEPVSEDLF